MSEEEPICEMVQEEGARKLNGHKCCEPVLENPVSTDTAMCLLDPHIKELVEAQRNDPSLKHCFEDAERTGSCFVIDEKTQVLFRCWERLKFKYNQLVVPDRIS